jgi:hypothetical protein
MSNTSRRLFLAMAATGTLSATTMAAVGTDDAELLTLEKEIFAAHDAASVYDDEVIRLSEIWQDERRRLDDEFDAGRSYLTSMERWDLVRAMPEAQEHDRLAKLQRPHHARQDALMARMFDIPAKTAEGRRAKVAVLLGCLMPEDWLLTDDDDDSDYPIKIARKLLIEFAGGAS